MSSYTSRKVFRKLSHCTRDTIRTEENKCVHVKNTPIRMSITIHVTTNKNFKYFRSFARVVKS